MNKKLTSLWGLSLTIISASSLVLSVCNIIGIDLPDIAVIIMGILDICALPVLVYTSVKIIKKKD